MSNYVVFNGAILPETEVRVSPLNRGMMYGDGCFETFRSYQNRFLKLEDHFNRLQFSLEYLGIDSPFGFGQFQRFCRELIQKNELSETQAMLRVQIWREGDRGYSTTSTGSSWIATSSEIQSVTNPITLKTVSIPVIPDKALTRKGKFSNGINYIRAAEEVLQDGADDALMLTTKGNVSETTISNVFWVKDNQIFAPSIQCDLLPGITRTVLIECMDVQEGKFELEDIQEAEAIFCTNSVREIIPVKKLDGKEYDPHHSMISLAVQKFEAYKMEYLK